MKHFSINPERSERKSDSSGEAEHDAADRKMLDEVHRSETVSKSPSKTPAASELSLSSRNADQTVSTDLITPEDYYPGPQRFRGKSVFGLPFPDQRNDKSDLVGPLYRNKGIQRDCKNGCEVDGTTYSDPFKIPGNEPTPLLHNDQSPVIGPDGQAIQGPSRGVLGMDSLAKKFAQNPTLKQVKFFHGNEWDLQRNHLDNGSLFTGAYRDFANVIIGFAAGEAGLSVDQIASKANFYCRYISPVLSFSHCNYPRNESPSSAYPGLSERLVKDYEIGFKLWHERRDIP